MSPAPMSMDTTLAWKHLALRLTALNRLLRAAVARQAAQAARLARPDLTPLCITDDQVNLLMGDVDALLAGAALPLPAPELTPEEAAAEERLRAQAAAAGTELPLDALVRVQRLTPFEVQSLLLCAAPQIDRSYERIYAYVLDDLNRRQPCIELLCLLGAATLAERLSRRPALGPHGSLRRTGMLRPWGTAGSEPHQELGLGEGMLDCLCGIRDPASFHDPAEVHGPAWALNAEEAGQAERLGHGLRDGGLDVVGVWGPARSGHADVAAQLALAAGMPLRRCPPGGEDALRSALDAAAALGALLWVPTDGWTDEATPALTDLLAVSRVPIVLTGIHAWRPATLLAERPYAELRIAPPDHAARHALWSQALPESEAAQANPLASRYRVGATEMRAAARTGNTSARLDGDGPAATLADHLERACATVLRPVAQRYATLIDPRRGPADLVLPPALHRQVMEVAAFYRAWPGVAEQWGYGRLLGGRGGIKALFTGDSGTGKTLAAEVIAGELGMPLLKIDLSQVVSKWVGETEQHLEALFREAEDSHGVLFFDEADALFGKRGEVQHGVDRYANLEVSYLLQRVEEHAGLVVLASNLKDNIDAAFTRRFQVTVHFPRPEPRERRRLWEIAFPPGAPLEAGLDLDVLARLDLTGAGITGAARTAALLAAAEGCEAISARHVAQALSRQYQREARVLIPSELGPYALLARDAA